MYTLYNILVPFLLKIFSSAVFFMNPEDSTVFRICLKHYYLSIVNIVTISVHTTYIHM